MPNDGSEPIEGVVERDRRAFLKHLAVVAPFGRAGEPPWLDVGAVTATDQSPEDAWRMLGYTPANTHSNPVATGPVPPIEVKWRVSAAEAVQILIPIIVGDTVYIGNGISGLQVFSTDQGANRWRYGESKGGARAPAVVDGTVYFGGSTRNVYALDVDTRELRWTFETDDRTFPPQVTTDTVYITEGGRAADPIVHALDAATGEERWQFTEASRLTVAVANDTVYVAGGTDGNVYALDAATGDEQWRFEATEGSTTPPAVANETVYVTSGDLLSDTNVYALDAVSGEELWRFEEATTPFSEGIAVKDDEAIYAATGEPSLYALDATTGDRLWRADAPTEHIHTPMVGGETVYIGSLDTNVYAFDAATGTEQWRFEEATEAMHFPVIVGETLYVGTELGTLYALT